jgi:beta-lactamase superfamily II metal-dependent hydrolase
LGNAVDAWFITHPHSDHVDALGEILPHPQDLRIGPIYASLPDAEWTAKQLTNEERDDIARFNAALKTAQRSVTDLKLGQVLVIDNIEFQVLGIRNPEITQNPLNNSSVVLRASDKTKSVLFLGDLGEGGGKKLLHGPYRDKLHVDYVQMAHHGQNGVAEDVYRAIDPSYCLWPTPRWLWDNDAGRGRGTGSYRTLEVRAWMAKLNVRRHYVSADGLQRID